MHGHLNVSIKDPKEGKYYRAHVTISFAKRHENYCLVSIGWTVDDDLPRTSFERLRRQGRLTEITQESWNHSGCQSRCKLRGAEECRW